MSLTKYKYVCLNKKCERCSHFVQIVKQEIQEREEEYCDECGELLKLLGEIPYGGYTKFSSLPSSEKSKMLLKRSHNHFNRFIKDKKEQLEKDFTNEVKTMKK